MSITIEYILQLIKSTGRAGNTQDKVNGDPTKLGPSKPGTTKTGQVDISS